MLTLCRAQLAIEEIGRHFKRFAYPSSLLECPEELMEIVGAKQLVRPLTTVQLEALYVMKQEIEQLKVDMERWGLSNLGRFYVISYQD